MIIADQSELSIQIIDKSQVQSALGVAEERADMSEQALARVRTRARSASLGPVSFNILKYLTFYISSLLMLRCKYGQG